MSLANLRQRSISSRTSNGGNNNDVITQMAPSKPPTLQSNVLVPQINQPLTSQDSFLGANIFPLPASITITVDSAAGVGAVATRVFLFNRDILQNITDNTSGAGSITYVEQDGTATGVVNSSQLAYARAGVGGIIFGVALRFIITASRAGDPVGLGASSPSFVTSNGYGATIPLSLNMSDNQTRGDFDTSIEVNPCTINLARFVQFGFIIPVADTAVATFYTNPQFKR